MYHPAVIAATVSTMETMYQRELREYTVPEIEEWQSRLSDVFDHRGKTKLRDINAEELAFIENELLMTKASFPYWASRYCFINCEGAKLDRMYPLWESQNLILAEVGRVEKEVLDGTRRDGVLVALLKARQLGGSTIAESALAHRSTTQDHVFGLIAADVPEQSAFMFDMYERVIDNLPWYLVPKVVERVKNTEIKFDGGSNVWVGSGKSTRGTTGERGQVARGKTLSVVHLSELSTFEDTAQIRAALLPACPEQPSTFVVFESSGRGRNNYWHKLWLQAKTGKSRFTPVFIPWYAEASKYTAPAPPSWSPSLPTLAHARKCEETGPRWVHHAVSLTRDQLYWYERGRAEHEESGELATWLENYCADPEEAFQFSGRSIFSVEVIQRIADHARPTLAVLDVGLNMEVQKRP